MSRSKNQGKQPSVDFWSARPFNKHGINGSGRFLKTRTHKAERQQGRAESYKYLRGLDEQ